MIRSSTAGSRPTTFAAALSLSQDAKDVIAVAITATAGHARRPWTEECLPPILTKSSPRRYVLPTKLSARLS
ncbi:hypothetical protein FOQG_16704 [Fusarium oxysporum f. sp. raphani 54005]|uniref:Uncharacterized protein n=4 Tax=Fusarium oxysporum TaxID=5507 RepID=X0BJK4_FUSOX|nr:hypothetical protein FOMG_18778 [Fusarium oxysporum f. sp. melonis 26406]EXK78639.1 hypothetical protein FOQG_16704 [Fusarium oxysporum f. sp. raphani 54005]